MSPTVGVGDPSQNGGRPGGGSADQQGSILRHSVTLLLFLLPSFVFGLVAAIAQQFKVVPVQRNVWVVNVCRRQSYLVTHLCASLTAPLAYPRFAFGVAFSA